MALAVVVTRHAAERLQQRCGIKINPFTEIYMGNDYVKVHSNLSADEYVDWYVNCNNNERAVLVVTQKTKCLKTVMTDGPNVDFAYAKLAKMTNKQH